MPCKNEDRKRSACINFRLTPDERDAIHGLVEALGVPLQDYYYKAIIGQKVEINWGFFDNERLAIELKKFREMLANDIPNTEEMMDDLRRCTVALEAIAKVLKDNNQIKGD